MEQRLFDACKDGMLDEVKSLLRDHPDLQIRWEHQSSMCWTALHVACRWGQTAIVAELLRHPDIDVNQRNNVGNTPFFLSCWSRRPSVVRLLLQDPRVDINLQGNYGYTPLRASAYFGDIESVEWVIGSGRDLNLGVPGDWRTDAIGQAKEKGKLDVVALLTRFKSDPDRTRHDIRRSLQILEATVADLFAIIVFVCDDYLAFKNLGNHPLANSAAQRFLAIAQRLPMELQMLLCHRVAGSRKNNVASRDCEAAFRDLAHFR